MLFESNHIVPAHFAGFAANGDDWPHHILRLRESFYDTGLEKIFRKSS
ncbi:MAG: hypothetical protein ABJJ74_15135 [Kangiellaceae bacterium]